MEEVYDDEAGNWHTLKPLPAISESKPTDPERRESFQSAAKKSLIGNATGPYTSFCCEECRKNLLKVFDHCLSKRCTTLSSPDTIDEVADGKRRKPPPFFHLIKDPSKDKSLHFKNKQDKVNREQRAWLSMRREEESLLTAIVSGHSHQYVGAKAGMVTATSERGLIVTGGGGFEGEPVGQHGDFSGMLYRQVLNSKSLQIRRLREIVMEKTDSEKHEAENVRKLRMALAKSMQYYIKAEEWQREEASLLQEDIRRLKTDIASIMAFIVHAEKDKEELRDIIKENHNTIANKNAKIKQLETNLNEFRHKLHNSLKDYLSLNDRVNNLLKEASTGSEAVQNRNAVLQKNLEEMSTDFKEASDELTKSRKKIKELEKELSEVIKQQSITSEAKIILQEEHNTMSIEYEATKKSLAITKDELSDTHIRIHQLEKELNRVHTDFHEFKLNSAEEIKKLSEEITVLTDTKTQHEGTINKLSSENARVKAMLKDTTKKKDELDVSLDHLQNAFDRETKVRDEKIRRLREDIDVRKATVTELTQAKNTLFGQFTDAQATVEREMTLRKSLATEIERWKAEYTEMKTTLKAEIDKLTVTKANMSQDKQNLTKIIFDVRQELRNTKEDRDDFEEKLASLKKSTATTEAMLRTELHNTKEDLDGLTAEHKKLREQHKNLTGKFHTSCGDLKILQKKYEDTASNLASCQNDLVVMTGLRDDLKSDKEQLETKKEGLEDFVERLNSKVTDLRYAKDQLERENQATHKAREILIGNMSEKTHELKEQIRELHEVHQQLREENISHIARVDYVKGELDTEKGRSDLLAEKLDKLRQRYTAERKLRIDFERMHQRLDRKMAEKHTDQITSLQTRERRLANVDDSLKSELHRLTEVYGIIKQS